MSHRSEAEYSIFLLNKLSSLNCEYSLKTVEEGLSSIVMNLKVKALDLGKEFTEVQRLEYKGIWDLAMKSPSKDLNILLEKAINRIKDIKREKKQEMKICDIVDARLKAKGIK